ncbi:MAG: HAMP domain-containing sensor histidine kinase [Isosphaeraceae bacterium]
MVPSRAIPRVAPPYPPDERGWLALVIDHQPIPVMVVELGTGDPILRNRAAGLLPLESDCRDASGPIPPGELLRRLAAEAQGEPGLAISWPATGEEFRVHARPLPTADGRAPFVLLTFLEVPGQVEDADALREALELRDEFFSVATHELKDPLFAMQLSLQLLRHAAAKQGPLPPYLAHHLDVSGRQAERLSRLIENLLDVSRIRERRIDLDPETFDLGDLAREVLGRLRETARAAGCALEMPADGPVVGVFDRLKLDQVLTNLLTNAIKYGQGRPVTVRALRDGEDAILEVADQGKGIDPADQGRIFARFERASESHRKESLGLGLYIVRTLVEAHGGTISVRSQPGQGATFTARIPRSRHRREEAMPEGGGRR